MRFACIPSGSEEKNACGERDGLECAVREVASAGRRARLRLCLVVGVKKLVERSSHALVHRGERARLLCADARAQSTTYAQHSQIAAATHHQRECHEHIRYACFDYAAGADCTSDRTRRVQLVVRTQRELLELQQHQQIVELCVVIETEINKI